MTRPAPTQGRADTGEDRTPDDVRSLKPIRTVQLDVVPEGQLALTMPVPTSIQAR